MSSDEKKKLVSFVSISFFRFKISWSNFSCIAILLSTEGLSTMCHAELWRYGRIYSCWMYLKCKLLINNYSEKGSHKFLNTSNSLHILNKLLKQIFFCVYKPKIEITKICFITYWNRPVWHYESFDWKCLQQLSFACRIFSDWKCQEFQW